MNEEISKKFRIVVDSSADILSLNSVPFAVAPLKIITDTKEYIDDNELDVDEMVNDLKKYKGKSTSSCPNPDEWLKAFGDSEYIFGVTISGGISGCYSAAKIAKEIYESTYPNRRVFIIDSLSAGPQEALLVEKLEEMITSGMNFDDICKEASEYHKKTRLMFMLESLTNFANNGRVSVATAKIAGLLGICIVGRASVQGTLEPTDKCRGLAKSISAILERIKKDVRQNGKFRIAHCFNESGANRLKDEILKRFPFAKVKIYPTRGLCSFYAEKGGLLLGYETE